MKCALFKPKSYLIQVRAIGEKTKAFSIYFNEEVCVDDVVKWLKEKVKESELK